MASKATYIQAKNRANESDEVEFMGYPKGEKEPKNFHEQLIQNCVALKNRRKICMTNVLREKYNGSFVFEKKEKFQTRYDRN